jgi:hypothetical protein
VALLAVAYLTSLNKRIYKYVNVDKTILATHVPSPSKSRIAVYTPGSGERND